MRDFVSLTALAVFLLITYLATVRLNRFKRVKQIQRKYGALIDTGNATPMTLDEAFEITMTVATLEFPSSFTYAIRLGMFKSYAIPSISRLLVRTGHFQTAETASLRAANTGALLTEIFFHPPGSTRGIQALARTNYLHSPWKKSGLITNDDMLYTLALSVLEPIKWVNTYEWRGLTPLETNALGMYFKSLGEMLHISYADLASITWSSGRQWLHELEEWAQQYEDGHMELADSNKKVATHVASALGPILRHAVVALLEASRREAIGFELPAWPYRSYMILPLLSLRGLCVRYFCLPRMRAVSMTGTPADEPGYYWAKSWSIHPWYMKPTWWTRYGPAALVQKVTGQSNPGDHGDRYQPQGYSPELIGPAALRGKGAEFMEKEKKWLHGDGASRCPFLTS